MTYLVTAATGNIGAATLDALLTRGQSVRASSRRAQDWPDGVEGVQADLNDPEAFTEAARDVRGAFVMAGYPSEAGLLAALPKDAHVVLLSSSAAPTGRVENVAARYHILSEQAVDADICSPISLRARASSIASKRSGRPSARPSCATCAAGSSASGPESRYRRPA